MSSQENLIKVVYVEIPNIQPILHDHVITNFENQKLLGILNEGYIKTFYPEVKKIPVINSKKVIPLIASKSKNRIMDIFGKNLMFNGVLTNEPKTNSVYSWNPDVIKNPKYFLFNIPPELFVLKKIPPNTIIDIWMTKN